MLYLSYSIPLCGSNSVCQKEGLFPECLDYAECERSHRHIHSESLTRNCFSLLWTTQSQNLILKTLFAKAQITCTGHTKLGVVSSKYCSLQPICRATRGRKATAELQSNSTTRPVCGYQGRITPTHAPIAWSKWKYTQNLFSKHPELQMLFHEMFCEFTLILLCCSLWLAYRGEVQTLSHCNINNRILDQFHPSL